MAQAKGDILVKVDNSPVHGQGVFVLEDIPVETCVCFYDGIRVELGDDMENQYSLLSHDGTHKIQGFETPQRPGGCGQLINDAARLFIEDPFDIESAMRAVIRYESESRAGCNVSSRDDTSKIFTHRPVKKNEEIFMHYGVPYWISDQTNRAAEAHNSNVMALRGYQKYKRNQGNHSGMKIIDIAHEELIQKCIESKRHSHAFTKLCSLFRTAPTDKRSEIARAVLQGRSGES